MDKTLGNQKVGISETDNNLKVNFFITTQGTGDNLTFGLQNANQYNTQINTYTVETTGMNLATDQNAYGNYDSTNILQNTEYTTDVTTNQYSTGFTDQYQNIETSNYTSQYGDNLGADILSQYQTGTQDLTSQYVTEDITNQYSTDYQNITNQYTGEAKNIVDQYTTGVEQYSGDNQDYSSYFNDNQAQNYVQSYNTTNTTVETTNYIQPSVEIEKPYMPQVDDINKNIQSSNKYYQKTTTTTKTTNVNLPKSESQKVFSIPLPLIKNEQDLLRQTQNEQKIVQLEGTTNSLKDQNQLIHDKLKALAGQLNSCRTQISLVGKNNDNIELNNLRAENRAIKQQLAELNQLRNDAAEVRFLRSQIKELDPLRRKAAEMEYLKGQLEELNILRRKVAELERAKAQLGELNRLKQQVTQMNLMKQQLVELPTLRAKVAELSTVKNQLGELNNLKSQVSQINLLKSQINELIEMKANNNDSDNLRKTIFDLEKKKLEYEYELKKLKDDQTRSQMQQEIKQEKNIIEFSKTGSSKVKSGGMESKQLLFEDKAEQICVKGEIIHNAEELELLTRKINKLNQRITLNLLYKATADSDKAAIFHEKCDDARCTLVLVETDKGRRFGGYTTCSWSGDCIDKKDEEAFVFSLDKMNIYENIPGEDAIGCYPKFGPIFLGCQIRIYDNAFTKGGTTYEKGLNYNTEEDYELTGGDREFIVKEIEVYEVICH